MFPQFILFNLKTIIYIVNGISHVVIFILKYKYDNKILYN